jgi:hypothetical protein
MADSPRVTAVIPVYNGARFIAAAIGSLQRQSLADIEILVVNDGSTDATAEIVTGIAATDPRVRLLQQPRGGQATANNLAETQARAPLLAKLDADDVALPDRLAKQAAFLAANPACGVVATKAWLIDPEGRRHSVPGRPTSPEAIHAHLFRFHSNPLVTSSVMLRRDVYRTVGGERACFGNCHDLDLWLRLGRMTTIAAIDEPLVEYRVHADQVSLTHVRQQAVECVAAFEADARRARGLPDPFSETSPRVSTDDLDRLGVSTSHLDDIVAAHVHGRHEALLASGMDPQAQMLLQSQRADTYTTPPTSRRQAYQCLMAIRQALWAKSLKNQLELFASGLALMPKGMPWLVREFLKRRVLNGCYANGSPPLSIRETCKIVL